MIFHPKALSAPIKLKLENKLKFVMGSAWVLGQYCIDQDSGTLNIDESDKRIGRNIESGLQLGRILDYIVHNHSLNK